LSLGQSASTQQPADPCTQRPDVAEQWPDWQSVTSLPTVQLSCPLAPPQLPLLPQRFEMQALACVQLVSRFGPAHVSVLELQRPLSHALLLSPMPQLSCKPSCGKAVPFESLLSQAKPARLQ
jgi:hypothetical protein